MTKQALQVRPHFERLHSTKGNLGPSTFFGVLANDFTISRTGPRSNATTAVRWGTLSSAARSRSRKRQVGLWRTMESLEARLAVEAGSSQLRLVILASLNGRATTLIPQLSPAKLLSLSVAAGKLPTHTNTTRRTAAANQDQWAYFTRIHDCKQVSTPFASQAVSSYQFVCMIGVFARYQRRYHGGAYSLGLSRQLASQR